MRPKFVLNETKGSLESETPLKAIAMLRAKIKRVNVRGVERDNSPIVWSRVRASSVIIMQ